MRRSKIVIPLHIVWATYQRHPLITEEVEEPLYRCIGAEAVRCKVEVLAIGGVEDHVHLAVMFPATVTVAEFVKQVKGASSAFATQRLVQSESFFRWQEGYAAYAFHIKLVPRVVSYIENQKEHHAQNRIWSDLEDVDEEAPAKP